MTRTHTAPAIPFGCVLALIGFGLFFLAVGIVSFMALMGWIR